MNINLRNTIIYYIWLIAMFILSPYHVTGQNSEALLHLPNHKYEGDYYFEDGTYITGGPMDEVKGSLVFIDPLEVSIGGVFMPETKFIFNSFQGGDEQIIFDFDKRDSVKGLWWKVPGKKSLYAEKKLSPSVKKVEFRSGEIVLFGELYLPQTRGPHPLIINVHGSGKQTRHLGPWNTFSLKYEIAVLCYDKRGAGESTGDFSTAGYTDFANDVLAAIEFAKLQPEIDTSKIGLHGSSEGGWVASIAASKSLDLDFMIVRVGSGVSGSDTYMHEVKNELKEKDLTDDEYIKAVRFERTIQDLAGDNAPLSNINDYIHSFKISNSWYPKAFGDYNGMSPEYYEKLKKSGPIDPINYLRKVSDIPVLWFLAEKDENVPYELSKPRLKDALDEAGNKYFELITIPGANHSFLVYTSDGKMKYALGYWDKIISWLQNHGITTFAN